MVPTFTVIRYRLRRPALPLRYRHGYAAVLHRGLPTGKINPDQEFPTRNGGAGTHRNPAQIHRV